MTDHLLSLKSLEERVNVEPMLLVEKSCKRKPGGVKNRDSEKWQFGVNLDGYRDEKSPYCVGITGSEVYRLAA